MSSYRHDQAVASDVVTLGRAIVCAERAHTGTGIWDVALEDFDEDQKIQILSSACLNDSNSHFHISRFHVMRHIGTEQVVSTACGFFYPTQSVSKSFPGIEAAISHSVPTYHDGNIEEIHRAVWGRLDFLDDCFPDFDYDNAWFIEAVFTDPAHRGHGLAQTLVSKVIAEGQKAGYGKKILITCAVGNEAARRVYERCGFVVVGQGHSKKAQEVLGSSGFYLLQHSSDSHSSVN